VIAVNAIMRMNFHFNYDESQFVREEAGSMDYKFNVAVKVTAENSIEAKKAAGSAMRKLSREYDENPDIENTVVVLVNDRYSVSATIIKG
jgi:hypothetical protein